ncbi:MAG: VCBS repeat-containing protein [Saprospiraceae bacterium]|nr:VCBS repeat-containing protein [Saprospiraceae bacterium]
MTTSSVPPQRPGASNCASAMVMGVLPLTTVADVPNCLYLAVKDVDLDGDADIGFTAEGSGYNLAWVKNDGNGNFGQILPIANTLPGTILADPADMDNDGDIDFVCLSATDEKLLWFRNDGNANFGNGIVIAALNDPSEIAIGDLDMDGDIDVVCASAEGEYLRYFRNLGDGLFATGATLSNSNDEGISDLLIEDIDNDGDLDLLATAAISNVVSIWKNTGDGTFPIADFIVGMEGPSQLVLADMDNDGDKDLICSAFTTNERRNHPVYLWENTVGGIPLTYFVAGNAGVSCVDSLDGFATIHPLGGLSPYKITWNDSTLMGFSQANMPSGNYPFTLTDAGGTTVSGQLIISVPPTLLTVMISTPSVGNLTNGSATAVVLSGNFPVSYTWSTQPVQTGATANNLVGGNYYVTITDVNGCTMSDSVLVDSVAALSLNVNGIFYLPCFGDSFGNISIEPNGGLPPFTIQWANPNLSGFQPMGLPAGDYAFTVTDAIGSLIIDDVVIFSPSQIQTTTQSMPSFDNQPNGTAFVNATFGIPPYSYAWGTTPVQTTDTIVGLLAGTYFVTVTDANGCTKTDSVFVEMAEALSYVVSGQFNLPCFGDSLGIISVVPSAGLPPYSITWDDPSNVGFLLTGLPAGDYAFTVTDAIGTLIIDDITIFAPMQIQTTTQSMPSIDNQPNGTAFISATFGIPPYSYAWGTMPVQTTDTIVGLLAGAYFVTVTDANGCTITDSVFVEMVETLSSVVSGQLSLPCFGESLGIISVVPSGGLPPYSITWDDPSYVGFQLTDLPAGDYAFTLTDALDSIFSEVVTISTPPQIQLGTQSTPDVHLQSIGTATASATGGTPSFSYLWDTSPIQTTETATGLLAGTYSVTVTDSQGCTATSTVVVELLTGTKWQTEGTGNGVHLAPNPVAQGQPFTLRFDSPMPRYEVGIVDALGKKLSLQEHSISHTEQGIEYAILRPGIFFIIINGENGQVWTCKVVVE